jgi:ribonucleoside-diphosphate reductase alpha chain
VQIPGINEFDANGLHAHNCGEQPLPPYGSCLLGSVNLTRFVKNAFTDFAEFDWNEYREVVKGVHAHARQRVEVNGLPLEQQRNEIMRKRRHGMGFLGLGSTITCLGMKYGAEDSIKFTEDVSREMAVAGWEAALDLAKEKGPRAHHEGGVHGYRRDAAQASGDGEGRLEGGRPHSRPHPARALQPLHAARRRDRAVAGRPARQRRRALHAPQLDRAHRHDFAVAGQQCLERHRASFAHHYFRNVIRPGKKTKEKVDVFSFELLAYRELINPRAMPNATNRPNSCLAISPRQTTSIRRSTSTSRPQRRGGSTAPFQRPRTCLRITNTRASKTSTCTPTRRI